MICFLILGVFAVYYLRQRVFIQKQNEINEAMLREIERVWIKPIRKDHKDTIKSYNKIFKIYNRKIERLEKMFVNLGHEDLLEQLCKIDMLADKNAKSVSPPKKPNRVLNLVEDENDD